MINIPRLRSVRNYFYLAKMRLMIWATPKMLKYITASIILFIIVDTFGLVTHILESDFNTNFSYEMEVNIPQILDSLKNGKKPPVEPINSYNYSYRISNKFKCKKTDNDKDFDDIFLLILVKSALTHVEQRNAIRNSWGFEQRFSDVKIRRTFLLGKSNSEEVTQDKIDEENSKFNDIIQADFIDNYYNNTIKTMMGFKWAVLNCPKAQFIFLVDDDMYVSIKNLIKFLRNPLDIQISASKNFNGSPDLLEDLYNKNQQQNIKNRRIYDGRLYGGYVFPNSHPMRHKPSKWYITLEEYPFSRFPPYVTAGAVAFSFPALLDMYYTSFYTKHFRFDDIYMAILALKADIKCIHNDNFHYHTKYYHKETYMDVIISHGFQPKEMLAAWHEQKTLGYA